jgi:hypothetical protein
MQLDFKRMLKYAAPTFVVVLSLVTSGAQSVAQADSDGDRHDRHDRRTKTTWGQATQLGDGFIQTYVTLRRKRPKAVGVRFSEDALLSFPDTESDGNWDVLDAGGNVVIPCCGHETVLLFPDEIRRTPFEHFVMNRNPFGHFPQGVYDIPHIDFHFYRITNEARTSIAVPLADDMCIISEPTPHPVPVSCETYEIGVSPLPDDMFPENHANVGAVEPGMGNHLIDVTAPEFSGETFTHTWIYGAYDGELTFYEPMITIDFLMGLSGKVCTRIGLPEKQSTSDYYPTEYCIESLDEDTQRYFEVSLGRFRRFKASR